MTSRRASRPALLATVALVAVLGVASGGCKRARSGQSTANLALDQTYTTRTKLLTLHYPKAFAANAAGEHSAALAPTALGPVHRESELYFTANMSPVSNEVTEYARIILDKLAENKADYRELARTSARCFDDLDGIEHVATFTDRGHTIRRWSCTFLVGGHGYSFGYFVALPDGEADEALLRRVVAATEIAR